MDEIAKHFNYCAGILMFKGAVSEFGNSPSLIELLIKWSASLFS